MTTLRVPADNFQVGDLVHTEQGPPVEVRVIERGELGELTVNPGAEDQLDGKVWQQATVTSGAPSAAEQYPIRRVRFVNGRTWHRTKRPADERWWDLLEAACGKTGYLERGFPLGQIRPCRGCQKVIGDEKES